MVLGQFVETAAQAAEAQREEDFWNSLDPGVRNWVNAGLARIDINEADGSYFVEVGPPGVESMGGLATTGILEDVYYGNQGTGDLDALVDQFTAGLPARTQSLIEAGVVAVRVDENGLPFLDEGPTAGLFPQRALDAMLGVPPKPYVAPSMTPYQAASVPIQAAGVTGYFDGAPTLARDQMQQQNALELAGLLGYVPGGDGGDPTATLAAQLGYGGLGIQQQEVDLRELLGLGGLGIQQQDLDLRQLLGLQGLGIQQQEVDLRDKLGMGGLGIQQQGVDLQRMLGLQGLDLERQQLGLNQGQMMGFYGGAPTLEAAQALGSLWGQPTLQAELGRRELAIAEAAQQTEWLRNPSNFIAAQLLRGGPGATVGGVTVPGRVAETIYGGALPNPSQLGYGAFGPAQVAVPSLQTLNQLNPDEIQAVGSAVPYLTGGAVTPGQFFGDAAYQGLRGY
ncbi:hypothetical protein [uncultured Mediterranean phage]|nr:hypothetical protein [uncultured Mediterranean phage]